MEAVRRLDWAIRGVLFIALKISGVLLSRVWGIIQVSYNIANQNRCLPVTALRLNSRLPTSLVSMCRWNLNLHLSWIQARVSTTSLVSLCVSAPPQDVPRWKAAQDEPGLYHRWCETHLLVLWLQAVNTGRTAVYPFTKRSCHLAQNIETFDPVNRCSEIVCWLWHVATSRYFSPPEKEISKSAILTTHHFPHSVQWVSISIINWHFKFDPELGCVGTDFLSVSVRQMVVWDKSAD